METRDRFTLLGPPIIVGLTTGLVHIASTEVLGFLIAWMLLSAPIGVLIGHCALSEKVGR